MGKVILICGKICSGKSCYARALQEAQSGVILSVDEATFDLIGNEQGPFYDAFLEKVNHYLRKKAVQIARAGANVILDWGFWTKQSRANISAFLKSNQIPYEWHYVDVTGEQWQWNIRQRNERVLRGKGGCDFFVDEGLLRKLEALFEEPGKEEMDVWHPSGKIIAACGNDCAVCPRSVRSEKTREQLHRTAELWFRIGYRDHVATGEEIACTGCKKENWCRYNIAACVSEKQIKTCGECPRYPCERIEECFRVTAYFEPACRAACEVEEFEMLHRAFFEKEKNLSAR